MDTRIFKALGVGAMVLGAWIAGDFTASAEPVVGLEAGGSVDVGPNRGLDTKVTGSFDGRFLAGYAFRVPLVYLEPEFRMSGSILSAEDTGIGTFMGGLRLGLGRFIEPSLFAHGGIDFVHVESGPTQKGPTFDAGAALDFRPIRWLTLGLTAGYQGFWFDEPGVGEGPLAGSPIHSAFGGGRLMFWPGAR